MRRIAHLLIAVLAVVSLASCASAPKSSYAESAALWEYYDTLPALVQASDIVVRARVVERMAVRAIDYGSIRGKIYYTDTRVAVEKYLKGTGSPEIVIRQIGNADIAGASLPDLPVLRGQARVLLFLKDVTADSRNETGSSLYSIVSPEGLYEVYGARLVTVALGHNVTDTADKTPLDAFEQMIEAAR